MKGILTILTGVGFLIAIYLFLNRGSDTIGIINAIASNTTAGIKTLQGRS